ncbi:MAG: tetratricopeptide repeat protein [Anaerolineae bacterium]|nr:tetratricopeptide repeat protein [Anaerolineae bacterium]
MLAYHYGRAANDEKGLEYALKAAHAARDIFANQEAVDLYTQAERHLQALGEEGYWVTAVELYLARSNVLMSLGNLNMAYEDTQKGLTLAQKFQATHAVAEAVVLKAEIRYRQGELEEVRELTALVVNELQASATPEQMAKAHIWAGWATGTLHDHQQALAHLQEAEGICMAVQNNYLLARVFEAQSYAYYLQKELKLSLAAMQKSVLLSREFSTPLNLGTAYSNVGFVQFMLGQYEEALVTFDEAVRIGRESGRNLLVMALANRGATLSRLGYFPEALVDFEEAIELLRGMNYPGLQVETYLFWGFEYSNVLGRWREGRTHFEKAAKIINQHPDGFIEERARLLIGLGQVELNEGDLRQAELLLHEAMMVIEDKELYWWRPVALYFMGQLFVAKLELAQAKQFFTDALDAFAYSGSPDYKPLVLLELARLESDERKQELYLRQCLTAVREGTRLTDRIVCLGEVGRLFSDRPDPELHQLGQECLREKVDLQNRTLHHMPK